MEEQNINTTGGENTSMPMGEAMPVPSAEPQPAQMPTPTPMPAPEPMQPPVVPAPEPMQPAVQPPVMQSQPMSAPEPMAPQVERMQMPMQPIDLTGQAEMPMQTAAPEEGGKKKMIIIAIVIVAALVAGTAGFFVWRMMNTEEPTEQMPIDEQQITIPTLPPTTEQTVPPAAPEADALSTIEQDLNTFNNGSIDTQLQTELNEINGAL